jgi:hypothetical protein
LAIAIAVLTKDVMTHSVMRVVRLPSKDHRDISNTVHSTGGFRVAGVSNTGLSSCLVF